MLKNGGFSMNDVNESVYVLYPANADVVNGNHKMVGGVIVVVSFEWQCLICYFSLPSSSSSIAAFGTTL